MNWAAISTVTILLFLLGLSLQASWQVGGLLDQVSSQLEVMVYLQPNVQVETLRSTVVNLPGVATVEVIPKEQAWARLLSDLGVADVTKVTQGIEGNPLVDELKVKVQTSAEVPKLAQQLTQIQGVDDVQYLEEALQHLTQLHQGMNWIGLSITAVLTLSAIAVITTTIRLIIVARQREIEVMQLVGATTAWIYLPFILQGITFGLVGAAISWGFIAATQQSVHHLLAQQPDFVQFLVNDLQLSPWELILLPLILLSFGGFVGLVGSLFAVRRLAVHR
jgi:cell division transport system permease protein